METIPSTKSKKRRLSKAREKTRSCQPMGIQRNRRGFRILAMVSAMMRCAHGIDSLRFVFGAVAMGAGRPMASVSAFRLPLFEQRVSGNFPSPRTIRASYTIPQHIGRPDSSALFGSSFSSQPLSMQQTQTPSTGWINSDTLNFQETFHNNSFDDIIIDSKISDDVDSDTKIKYPSPSSVERLLIRDRLVYIKRDDVLHLPSSNISGNKARKFLSLNNIPASEFPEAIVSYGGPQSNAMVALAAIVSSKNAELSGEKLMGEDDDWLLPNLEVMNGGDMFWQLDVSDEEVNGKKVEKIIVNKKNSEKSQSSSSTKTINTIPTANTKRFIYYTKTIPRYLRNYPNGNLLRALALGMEIRTVSHEEYNSLFGGLHGGSVLAPADLDPPVPGKSLWIPQGGACSMAQPGSDVLAREIVDYWSKNGKGMPLGVCVPGGTCTTALLLHRSINILLEQRRIEKKEATMDIRLVVIPCVGDDEYAMRQMRSLDRSMGGKGRPDDMPFILKPRENIEYGSARRRSKGYFRFGEPAKALLETFDEMKEHGLFLDLLYGAPAFSLLLQHWRSRDDDCPIAGRQVMYVHSGGLEGIASQLTRYKHKGLIEARTIQTT